MLGDGRDEVFGAGTGGLDVFCADFEDFFEIYANIGELALQEDDDLVTFKLQSPTTKIVSASRSCCARLLVLHRRFVIGTVVILTRIVGMISAS